MADTREGLPETEWLVTLIQWLIREGYSLPPAFWEHLGRGLQELAEALRILAEHVPDATDSPLWLRLYETFMEGDQRLGRE